MLSYIVILTAVALLVSGVIFIITGWSGSSDDAVVAIADLEEFKAWTSAHSCEKKVALESIPESPPAAPVAQKQEIPIGYPEKFADLEIQLRALEETMAGKAAVDQDKIAQLTYENNKLKKQVQEREAEFSRLTVEIEAAKNVYEHLLAQEGSKAEDFQKNTARLAQEKEALLLKKDQESISKVSELEVELAAARQADAKRQAQFNDTLTRLKAENQSLLEQGQESRKQTERLRGNIELMQKINNQKLNEANEAMHRLEIQRSESDRIQQDLLDKQLSRALAEVDEFKKDREQLLQVHDGLERDFTKIKDMNTYLLEKEELLQYELTKERAQSLGLERICEDFKIQIDEMAKSGVTNW